MSLTHFETCLPEAAAAGLPELMERVGRLAAYVEAPAADGVGRGMVRRHDAVLNYVRSKMARGQAEPMHVTAARTNLFRRTFYERGVQQVAGAEALFEHAGFGAAATAICGAGEVRPTMLYANLLLPGQELAVHVDTPEFRGLDKQDVPEWLLVVMGQSGLFQRWRTPIAAAVAFFSACEGGAFLVWADGAAGESTAVQPRPNTAVALDADGCFHGVGRVGGADAPAPVASPGATVRWDGKRWRLDDRGREVADYGWDEVRLSFQWKAQVLGAQAAPEDVLDEARALALLVEDLRRRGVIGEVVPTGPALGLTLIDTYLSFPSEA